MHYQTVVLRPVDRSEVLAEADLVERCVAGDPGAQRELFRTQFARVHATLFRLAGSLTETEDLAQETFLEAFRSLRRFRGEARLATWIDRIATRVAFRHFGRRKPAAVPLELVADIADEQPGIEHRAAAREGVRRLYALLDTLSPGARVAFALWAIDGRTIAEIARLTGSSQIAAKVRIWRARRTVEKHAAGDPVLATFLAGSTDT